MTPLWPADNHTVDSDIFIVRPGEAALLVAAGLLAQRVRTSEKDFNEPQYACLSRIVSTAGVVVARTVTSPCPACSGSLEYASSPSALVEVPVMVDGCPWVISACNNFRILAIPGTYRLHLNDETAVGESQVYVDIYKLEQLAPNIKPEF